MPSQHDTVAHLDQALAEQIRSTTPACRPTPNPSDPRQGGGPAPTPAPAMLGLVQLLARIQARRLAEAARG